MRSRPLPLVALAVLTAAGAVAVWLVALGLPRGRALDAAAMLTFGGVATPPLQPSIMGVAHLADPLPFVVGALLLSAIALLRQRWLMAAVVPAILLSANVTTQVLQPALADVRLIELQGIGTLYPGSWPSGHATASMSLALCLVLVVGPRLRPIAALAGAGYAVGVGYALVALGWHLPSDVVGGYLVAATFTLLGAAALMALETHRPALARRAGARVLAPLSVPALAGGSAVVVALVAAVVLVLAPGVTLSALGHPVAIAAGLAIGALGLTLTAGLAVVLRR